MATDPYKKRLATASLAQAQAMDKAYADAYKKGLKDYTYNGLKYAVAGAPGVTATDLVKTRKPVVSTSANAFKELPQKDLDRMDYVSYNRYLEGKNRFAAENALAKGDTAEAKRLRDISYGHLKEGLSPEADPYDLRAKAILDNQAARQPKPFAIQPQYSGFNANTLKQPYVQPAAPVARTLNTTPEVPQEPSFMERAFEPVGNYLDKTFDVKGRISRKLDKAFAYGGSLHKFDIGGPITPYDEEELLNSYQTAGVGGGTPAAAPRTASIINGLNNARKSVVVGAGDVKRRMDNMSDASVTNMSSGLQAGAQAINVLDGMDGKPSTLGGIGSGAMSGASMGASLGSIVPGVGTAIGAVGGAVIGGGLALLQAEKKKKEEAEAKRKYGENVKAQQAMTDQQTMRNYASQGVTSAGSYAYGGYLQQYADGGTLDEFGNLINKGVTKATRAVLPINAAMLAQDVTGTTMKKFTGDNFLTRGTPTPLTEKDLTPEEMAVMRKVHANATERSDRSGVPTKYYGAEYDDYGTKTDDIDPHDFPTLGHALIDPTHRMQTTIGGASVKRTRPGEDAIITDKFDFTGPHEQELMKNMRKENPLTNPYAGIYGRMNNIGSTTKGSGIPVKINLGKPKKVDKGTSVSGSYAYGGDLPEFGKGGKIHIKKENRGKFTAYKKRTGKTTEEALHSKDPHVRQMANFARNAAKWHHKGRKKKHGDGGRIYAYPYGGPVEPEYEVEQGEMVQGQPQLEEGQQVASDMYEVGGERHENGGTDGAGGERVYSDRMKTANKKTYAEEAKDLAKQKAKFEAKIPDTNEAISNTGHRMSERMDMKLDELFKEQEMKKQLALPPSIYSSMPAMANGGRLPKYPFGTPLPNYLNPNAQYPMGVPYGSAPGSSVKTYPQGQGWRTDPVSARPFNAANRRTQYNDETRGRAFGAGTGEFVKPGFRSSTGIMNTYVEPTMLDKQTGTQFYTDYSKDPNAIEKLEPRQSSLTGMNAPLNKLALPTLQTQPTGDGGATAKAMKHGNGIPWQYVDNLASGIMTANTPELARPYMDPRVNLNTTFDINPQLQSARNAMDATNRSIGASTPQGGASSANRQQLFASSLDNANGLYAQKNNIENELKNKEILLNSNINSRNMDKQYAYDVENVKRRAGIQEDIVGNARNFALDQYTSARDAKMDARDLESIKQIAMANPNSADYGYNLQAFKDMYANNPNGLKDKIAFMEASSPNSPALKELKAYYATLTK